MSTRRSFLQQAGTLSAGIALTAGTPRVHAAETNTIRLAVVGCGGRGTGACLDAFLTPGPKQLVAMADVFPQRMEAAQKRLHEKYPNEVNVPKERRFTGMNGFRHAIDAVGPGGLVLLATPPAFRPQHVEYAVAQGVHVFMEKSFGVDPPGVRRILRAGEEARRKNLKIAGGLMSRHSLALEEAIRRLHDGMIGERITCCAYRVHTPVGFSPRREGESVLAHQVRNYSCFTWLNGSFLLDWLIHNLDVACWSKNAWPVSARGFGGRQQRTKQDQLFDHQTIEYTFPDGTRLFAQAGHMDRIWNSFQCTIFGQSGCAVLGEGVAKPKIYRGHRPREENKIWEYEGNSPNPYHHEHTLLFDAIRSDKPLNETERCCQATLVGILGRMAMESGREVTWEEMLASTKELAPGLDQLTWEGPAPVLPDASGDYPIAVPGGDLPV